MSQELHQVQGQAAVAYSAVPHEAAAPQVAHDLSFSVKAHSRIKTCVDIVIEHPTVIEGWGAIRRDFVHRPVDLLRVQALLDNTRIEEAVHRTLQCWANRKGRRATFQALLDTFSRRAECRALTDELAGRADEIRRARDSGIPEPLPRECNFYKIGIALALTVLVLAVIALVVVFGFKWPPSPASTHPPPPEAPPAPTNEDYRSDSSSDPVRQYSETIYIEGSPGNHIDWSGLGAEIDCTNVTRMFTSFIHLGPTPNIFVRSIKRCTALRVIQMSHMLWDGEFSEKIELPNLEQFSFESDHAQLPTGTVRCSSALEDHVNSLIFFRKGPREGALDQAYMLDTSITISATFGSWWFTLIPDRHKLSVSGLPASLLKRISLNQELQRVQFSDCGIEPTDLSKLDKVKSLVLINTTSAVRNLRTGLRQLLHLKLLHFDNRWESLDLCDIISPSLQSLRIFYSQVSVCNKNQRFPKLERLHLNDVIVADETVLTEFGRIFSTVGEFVLTSTEKTWPDDRLRAAVEKAVEEKQGAAIKYDVRLGHVTTFHNRPYLPCPSCGLLPPPPADKCPGTAKWSPAGENTFVCQECISNCDHISRSEYESLLQNRPHVLSKKIDYNPDQEALIRLRMGGFVYQIVASPNRAPAGRTNEFN